MNEETCTWATSIQYESENWETDCGEIWCLIEGTPKENRMNYCPYCGKRLVEVLHEWDNCDD